MVSSASVWYTGKKGNDVDRLAILGGPPAVTVPRPHFVWPVVGQEEIEAVLTQLQIGELSIRDRSGVVKEFEDEFASYHGMRYAIATNSGTTAIHSALFGCGVGPGDEVLVPTYTFLATATPVLHVNAIPVLVEAEPGTGNVDPADLRRRITARTRAIVVTHLWGHPCEMDAILQMADEYGLAVIEDCSHAHGSTYRGQKVGTFGRVSCFSLQASKMLPAGEGGILLTDSIEVYERATLLGHFNDRSRDCVTSDAYRLFAETGYGLKYRMHVLAAALARVGLRHLDERIRLRGQNLNSLSRLLAGIPGVEPPPTRSHVTRGAFYRYEPSYRPEELDGLPISLFLNALQAEGVEVEKPKDRPLHLTPLFQTVEDGMYATGWPRRGTHVAREVTYRPGDFPVAEDLFRRAIRLPTFTGAGDALVIEQYAAAFHKVASRAVDLYALAGAHHDKGMP